MNFKALHVSVMNWVFPILSEMPSHIVDHALPFHTLSGSLKRHAYIHLFVVILEHVPKHLGLF